MRRRLIRITLLILFVLICCIIAACDDRTDNHSEEIDDRDLPMNVFNDVIFSTSDGSNYILIESKKKKIDTNLVLVNLSEYDIILEIPICVRLQKKTDDSWQFVDKDPYSAKSIAGSMKVIYPHSLMGEIPVSIDIESNDLDFEGEYRFYLPIEYRPSSDGGSVYSNDTNKACVVVQVVLDTPK